MNQPPSWLIQDSKKNPNKSTNPSERDIFSKVGKAAISRAHIAARDFLNNFGETDKNIDTTALDIMRDMNKESKIIARENKMKVIHAHNDIAKGLNANGVKNLPSATKPHNKTAKPSMIRVMSAAVGVKSGRLKSGPGDGFRKASSFSNLGVIGVGKNPSPSIYDNTSNLGSTKHVEGGYQKNSLQRPKTSTTTKPHKSV